MDSTASIFVPQGVEQHKLLAEFTVHGEPVSKARARFTKQGSKTVAYTPEKTKVGEHAMAAAYLKVAKKFNKDPEAAYAMRAHFYNGTRQRRDVDNMVKLVLDGLNRVAWVDDNQVLEIAARKSFVSKVEARTVVQVYLIGDLELPKKPCAECGELFRTYDSWENSSSPKIHCSPVCTQAAMKRKLRRECQHCGNEFEAPKSTSEAMYCSMECSYEGRRTVASCCMCDNEFTIQRCHVRKRNYCSDECKREQDRIVHKERRSKHFPGTCLICGGGTTRKEYTRCNPCKKQGVTGKPREQVENPGQKLRPKCAESGCKNLSRTRGMCGKHYAQTRRAEALAEVLVIQPVDA
ncbi:RusA family crossover junction endodeoxyribonuclease [Glutamicibacter arilaitensis]|uniref:RusA family crossover junction endodeoxyribonuclease n=1 Tax=Glutamicibacter arilaitensis TaxID=256701 RepID=UPI00384EEFEF